MPNYERMHVVDNGAELTPDDLQRQVSASASEGLSVAHVHLAFDPALGPAKALALLARAALEVVVAARTERPRPRRSREDEGRRWND